MGSRQLVRLPNLWQWVVTHKWPNGDLTVQILEDFSKGPPYRFAITGGTGDYEGAQGEITFVSSKAVTFSFTTR